MSHLHESRDLGQSLWLANSIREILDDGTRQRATDEAKALAGAGG